MYNNLFCQYNVRREKLLPLETGHDRTWFEILFCYFIEGVCATIL